MEEKREISRVQYDSRGVLVVCESGKTFAVQTVDVSPLGMGIYIDTDLSDLLEKDIIVVTGTMIMYADVMRQEKCKDGKYLVGIAAKNFTPEVLEYLFTHIGTD